MATKTLTDADFQGSSAPTLTDADFQAPAPQGAVTPPTVQTQSTYLTDKDMVVNHPADMSHDQVNDAIQTSIYEKPRINIRFDAPTPDPKVYSSFQKGMGKDAWSLFPQTLAAGTRGLESGVQGVSGLLQWFGENLSDQAKINDPEYQTNMGYQIGQAVAKIGTNAIEFYNTRKTKGLEAPDPEIFRGSFVSNPSFTRLTADVAQGIPTLAAAALITLETGNPILGAGALGLVSGGEQYTASKSEGAPTETASMAMGASVVGNTILMSLPLGKVLEGYGGGRLASVAKGAAEFAGVSAVMTPFNNLVAALGGDKARRLFDGMTESILAGAVSGGILGGFTPGRGAEVDNLVQEAHNAGVAAKDIDGARAEIAKQITENPSIIEKKIQEIHFEINPPENFYVKREPISFEIMGNDKMTAQGIREEFAGVKNAQIVRGNQLAEEVRQMVPNKAEREGMFWYKAAEGDMNVLAEALASEEMKPYHDQIKAAMNLSENAIEALKRVNQYYEEAGAVSREVGTIGNVRENYQNRIYAPDKPKDFVKTETKSGLKQSTSHAKRRVFDTEFEAAAAGKTFATTDIADALAVHNEEMARVNTSRKLAETLVDKGLAAWKKEAPDGWAQIGNLQKKIAVKDKNGEAVIGEDGNQIMAQSSLVAPEGIAKGLEAISDPNFTKKIDALREIQKYQGLVKTVDLSFSFFHHLTMGAQTLYQGGVRALMHIGVMDEHMATHDFKELERDFTRHDGMTSNVEANQDILRNLVQHNDDIFSKVTNMPVMKQALEVADKSANFLFGKIQRYLKVSDYGAKISNWVADHPTATSAEVVAAKKGFSKEINAAYGGLNWEAMGITKSNLSLLRLALLAPDWTISNIELLKYAIGDKGTAGQASRAHIVTALVGGMVLTEGLNKILTGHFTDKNKKGHQLEIEISPNVYVSMLRGGIGDITKAGSMLSESGLLGASRFLQGKLAPFPRTAIGLLTNTQYTGAPIGKKSEGPIANTFDVLKYLVSSLAPMPLGVSTFLRYIADQSTPKTIQGGAAVLTGAGRYSKSGKSGGGINWR